MSEAKATQHLKRRAWNLYEQVTIPVAKEEHTSRIQYYVAALSLGGYKPGTISTYTNCVRTSLKRKGVKIDEESLKQLLKGAG